MLITIELFIISVLTVSNLAHLEHQDGSSPEVGTGHRDNMHLIPRDKRSCEPNLLSGLAET